MTDQPTSKILPLVYYHPSGEREVIGQATVRFGGVSGHVRPDISDAAREVIASDRGSFSIGPFQTPSISDSKET